MARLRKAGGPEPPTIFMPASATPRGTRSSPRKALTESPSKRELRYTSSQDAEDSFLVPKFSTGDTPARKQRVLRPVESNSRLLRKLSDDSLATPERRERRERLDNRESALRFSYSKSLARTVAKRPAKEKRIEIEVEETVVDEKDNEMDQSLWCGDEEEAMEENKENVPEPEPQPELETEPEIEEDHESESEDEDEDDEPVLTRRPRQRQARRIISDSESDSDEDAYHSAADEPDPVPEMPPPLTSMRPPFRKGRGTISNWAQDVVDLTGSPEPPSFAVESSVRARTGSFAASDRPTSSASNDVGAILRFSPTPKKQRSPCKEPPRPSTPPAMESPSKLVSPSKKKMRIPQVPDLRPSLDAFWNPEVVNDWNDKHSPVKPLVSPRKQKPLKDLDRQTKAITIFDDGESDASFTSPAASPRKKSASPAKRSVSPSVAQIRAQKKDFASRKHALAEEFLAELDNTIAEGRIASLSQSTGGIKLVWSKTLKTTAGRANWRRETLRLRNGPEPTDVRTEIRHHCSIELADKVIDDEERLANVLAHEFCHLTTFMISGVRNNPHGAEFKAWGRKATEAFQQSRNVVVTTKHSYQIDYKFVWECTECGYEFKRHSRSVDPARHSCGRCKGKLVQTKPVPRGQGKTADGKGEKKSEYQSFVKENFARVKKGMEAKGLDVQMGKVMEEVAREYRERKAEKAKVDVAEVELALEGLNLG